MKLTISATSVFNILKYIITFLVLAHIVQITIYHLHYIDYIKFLDLDIENNLPSFYSTMAIELCALILFFIYINKNQQQDRERKHWLGLTIIFAFLGFDEMAQIHEEFSDIFDMLIDASGLLYFPWVIPYGIAVAVVGIIYLPWLLRLPKHTRQRFIIAGMAFLGGAIVVEMISANYADLYGDEDWRYSFTYTIEETLEMTGIALFARALLLYISETINTVEITFSR